MLMGTEKARIWRTASEKRRIVELTLQAGMSVARVAQAEGVNSHQVFQWRRAYRQGTLGDSTSEIHIELPGRATITAEHGADASLLRMLIEALLQ